MDGMRRLMAVLEADVVGYSRLVARDDARTAQVVSQRMDLIRNISGQHNGQVVNLAGDSILVVFASALGAVQAAILVQQKLESINGQRDGGNWPMHFRIGIDLGDVFFAGDQPTATAVNTAARLEKLADAGGICLSGAVFAQIYNRVDVKFHDMGDQTLKNIPIPVRAFKALVYGKPASAGPGQLGEFSLQFGGLTQVQRREFVSSAFKQVLQRFKSGIIDLRTRRNVIDATLEMTGSRMFVCRAFGEEVAQGTIWLMNTPDQSGYVILYSSYEVQNNGTSTSQERIALQDNSNPPSFKATGKHVPEVANMFDLEALTTEDVAHYLWELFVRQLTRPLPIL